MSPRAKRWAGILLRIAFTTIALVIVVRMIRLHDQVRILRPEPRETEDVRKIERAGDRVTLRWKDGRTTEHPTEDVVVARLGFLSLFAAANKPLLVALIAALIVPCLILGTRWWLLLRGHGFDVGFGRAFYVTYAGIFFNNFLPGGVGGDLTKAILVSAGEERKAAAVGTVVLDRLIGLAVLIFLGAACLAPFVGEFESPKVPVIVFGLAGGVILVYLLYFSETLRGWIRGRLPFREAMGQLDGVFRSAKERKPLMGAVAGLSLLSQVISIFIIVGLARALGIHDTPMWTFFVFEPIIFIIVALPISIGGLGVQEWAYAYLFGTFAGMDPNQAVALSVLYKLSMILVSIPGGLLFALGAARRRVPPQSV